MIVRSYLHNAGIRFRLHDKSLPGKPDIILKKYNTVIFVDGCFWHRHAGCKYCYEPKSKKKFWQTKFDNNIKRDEIVVDLGAHIGYYTLMMAKLVGQNGKVFAFQPEPRNLKLLYKNIEVVPKAVSDIDGECTLFVGQESFGANKIFKPKKTDTQEFEEIKTRMIRLDDYFEELMKNDSVMNVLWKKN